MTRSKLTKDGTMWTGESFFRKINFRDWRVEEGARALRFNRQGYVLGMNGILSLGTAPAGRGPLSRWAETSSLNLDKSVCFLYLRLTGRVTGSFAGWSARSMLARYCADSICK